MRPLALLCAALAGCAGAPLHLPPAREAPGRVAIVQPHDDAAALPPDHAFLAAAAAAATEEPIASRDHTGRAPRRLTVDQLRAALLAATGFTWVASRRVSDPESASGFTQLPDADMLDALAPTLGRADYAATTSESTDPAVTFSKLAGDAARSACRASVKADVALPEGQRRILRFVAPGFTTPANAAAVRKNLAYLALRFWGRRIEPGDAQVTSLNVLFDRASRGGTPLDGWRAVCIAMATDPAFLTY